MSLRFLNPRKLAGLALMGSCATALAATPGSGYLPITGPTPLRFEAAPVIPTNTFASVSNTVTAALAQVEPPTQPLGPPAPPTPANLAATEFARPTPPPASEDPVAPIPFTFANPADNLLITPQMLAEYFRPLQGGASNGVGVAIALPAAVMFTPPTIKPTPTSRATYKVQ